MKKIALVIVIACLYVQNLHSQPVKGLVLPQAAIVTDSMGASLSLAQSTVHLKKINDTLYYVVASIAPGKDMRAAYIDIPVRIPVQDAAAVNRLKQSFHWLPNMKSAPGQIVAQHVFRSPCIIVTLASNSVVLIPDVQSLAANTAAPYYLDLQYSDTGISLHYGLSNYTVTSHQYYKKSNKSFTLPATMQVAFYLLMPKTAQPLAVLKATNSFLWQHVASNYTRSVLPQTVPFSKYAEVGYNMALQHYWVDAGKGRGGITLSTFYDDSTKVFRGRYGKDDLWYQSWFNNMRTAYGLFSWGRQLQHEEWKQKALATVQLLLDAPNDGGWFPTVYNKQADSWLASGQGGGPNVYHVPDNAWAAYWLLRFNDEMQNVPGAVDKLVGLGDAIIKVQNTDGSFPTRVDIKTHLADTVLNNTASSAIATWYLEELLLRGKVWANQQGIYREVVKKSLAFLSTHVLPQQRFEDFESYFSCSPKPMHYFDTSTNMYSQNTLSIQWCAEAYLKASQLFGDKKYLALGEYCLNILSLYQQVWNPPFISLYAFGGFGTQNSDAEWSDARQAQFADTYLQYYQATQNIEYLQRAVYACRASFALMVMPENKTVGPNNYTGTPINGEQWDGTMAENYGHGGIDERSHQSGFHWGTGSALTTAAILTQTLGGLYLNFSEKTAVGIDGVVVTGLKWGNVPQVTTQRIDGLRPVIYSDGGSGRSVVLDGVVVKVGK